MLDILKAIRKELQDSSIINYIKDNNIIITEIENYIPNSSELPLITIKDYGSSNNQQLSQKYYQTSRVIITIFNRILKVSDSILNPINGILKIEKDILDILIDNHLNICEITNAFPITQEQTRNIVRENDIISYKRLIMEYSLFKKW